MLNQFSNEQEYWEAVRRQGGCPKGDIKGPGGKGKMSDRKAPSNKKKGMLAEEKSIDVICEQLGVERGLGDRRVWQGGIAGGLGNPDYKLDALPGCFAESKCEPRYKIFEFWEQTLENCPLGFVPYVHWRQAPNAPGFVQVEENNLLAFSIKVVRGAGLEVVKP